MVYTPNGVVSHGFPLDDDTFTYLLTGQPQTDAGAAEVAGRALTQDKTKPNAVKLAGDGDEIFGRGFLGENRAVQGFMTAAVQRRFKEKLPANAGHGIAIGDNVVGAGSGRVKKAGAGAGLRTVVVEVIGNDIVVERL